MVRAILDGRKTQTRRICKCICNSIHHGGNPVKLLGEWGLSTPPFQWDGEEYPWNWTGERAPKKWDWIEEFQTEVDDHATAPVRCPWSVGEHLWVKETWRTNRNWDHLAPNELPIHDDILTAQSQIDYLADGTKSQHGKTRVSIHMPRWASRIDLEITEIRVQRLQDISEEDILSEGVTVDRVAEWCNYPWSSIPTLHHAWKVLWESINGADSWSANPWVWAINFKRVNG
jgi:hypothetical protein